MKNSIITIVLYILFAFVAFAVGCYNFFLFVFDDIIKYYLGGILIYVFALIILSVVVFLIIKYKNHSKKYVLPLALCIALTATTVFNNGILKYVEDNIRIYSAQKWQKYKKLRIYMIDSIENHYLHEGDDQQHVKNILGEPDYVKGDNSERYEYFISPGFVDPVMYYIEFKDGCIIKMGKYSS